MREISRGVDAVGAALAARRGLIEPGRLTGTVHWELSRDVETHPGVLVRNVYARGRSHNLVTQVGDQYYMERAVGIGSPPAQVTGMKLGTGSTAPSKTGAGAALDAYLSDSHQAIAGSYPQSSVAGSARRITWQAVWAAGKATTAAPITEVVLVNNTLADATSTDVQTIARALLTGIAAKGAADTLTVTWHHDLQFS